MSCFHVGAPASAVAQTRAVRTDLVPLSPRAARRLARKDSERAQNLELRDARVREKRGGFEALSEPEKLAVAIELENLARDYEAAYHQRTKQLHRRMVGVSRPNRRTGRHRRSRRSSRRVSRVASSRRAQVDSGGSSDGDGPGDEPPGVAGSSLLQAYGLAPVRPRRPRDQSSTARLEERAACGCSPAEDSCGRGSYSDAARVVLRLGSAASEAPLWGAGPRSGRRGAGWP
jgi:hypothetical protein